MRNKDEKRYKSRDKESRVVEEIKAELKKKKRHYQIKNNLLKKNHSEEEADELIRQAVKAFEQDRMERLSPVRLGVFGFFVLATLGVLFLSFFVFPKMGFYGFTIILSILGSFFAALFAMASFAYFKSWIPVKEYFDKARNTDFSQLFLIAAIPALIMVFVMQANYKVHKRKDLNENKAYATGYIATRNPIKLITPTTGEYRVKKVSVQFNTKEGKKISGKQDLDQARGIYLQFKQKILVEYSSKYPKNFRMVFDPATVIEQTGSQERIPEVDEIIALLKVDQNKVAGVLDKIIFGWHYEAEDMEWVNRRYGLAVRRNKKELVFTSTENLKGLFEVDLRSSGFVLKGTKFYESDTHKAHFQVRSREIKGSVWGSFFKYYSIIITQKEKN